MTGAANIPALEAAMASATASHAPVERKLTTTREEYQAARADLDARARAGRTVQSRNNKGHFTRGSKVFTAGVAPVAQVPAVVEKRAMLEAMIERAIDLLDQIDGDADLELEPDLEESFNREVSCEDEGAQCDDEGAPGFGPLPKYHPEDQRIAAFKGWFGTEYRSVA